MPSSAGSRWGKGPVVDITSTPQTLTSADSGKIFRVNVADCVFNLPATEEELMFTFVIDTVSATTGCQLSPVAADNINGGTDDKDLINTAATDAKGDNVTLVGDGSEGWVTAGMHGIWAEEA